MDSFCALLGLFPSLTSLDMEFSGIDESHLVALATMNHLRLRTLKLDNNNESDESMSLLINSFGSTLEVLHTGDERPIDAETLHLLASKCRNLRSVTFYVENMSSQVLAAAFGPGTFPLLESQDSTMMSSWPCASITPISNRLVVAPTLLSQLLRSR